MRMKIKQGNVYIVNLNINSIGSEQNGQRMCIIVQRNIGNDHSSTTWIVPLTKKQKEYDATHYILNKDKYSFLTYDSVVLCEQLKTVDSVRLERMVGWIDKQDLLHIIEKIDENMKIEY
jgi:mRNA interferase MazF